MGDFTKLGMYRHSAPPAAPRARKMAEKAAAKRGMQQIGYDTSTGNPPPWGSRRPHSSVDGHRHPRTGGERPQ